MIDLDSPTSIRTTSEISELIEQIDSAIEQFNTLRPLAEETENRIKLAFLPDRVTASLNMEGIVATRRQTLAVLDAMTLEESHTKTEQEILNALRADEHTYEIALEKDIITEVFIRDLNRLIEHGIGETPGRYRDRGIKISHANFIPPGPHEIRPLMQELVSSFNSATSAHPIVRAVWLHARFTYIHPFLDGNGRTGRLMQDFALLSGGLFPTGIPTSKRDDYYDALAAADKSEWSLLLQIVAIRELEIVAKASAVAQERRIRQQWVKALAKRAQARKTGALHKQYLIWFYRMTEIRAAFELAAAEFNNESDFIQIRHENFEHLDFPSWKEVCEQGYGRRTWFFSQTFQLEDEMLYKFVFYFRRHRTSQYDTENFGLNNVSLYVTGGEFNQRYEFGGRFEDREVRLREILLQNEKIMSINIAPIEDDNLEMSTNMPISAHEVGDVNLIVQDFFEDVLVKKMGV
jgi:Fic family protein